MHSLYTAALVGVRTGVALSRSQLLRLHEVSGGKPMLALGLASGVASRSLSEAQTSVPASLRHLVADRVSAVTAGERDVLLTCALSGDATVASVCAAATDPATAPDDLDAVLRSGLLAAGGDRLVFTHPLLRSVIIDDAGPADRRTAHRRLAAAVDRPEVRARHLALGTVGPDEPAADSAETAARIAGARGACETAADLAALAVGLTRRSRMEDRHRRIALEANTASRPPTRTARVPCCDPSSPRRNAAPSARPYCTCWAVTWVIGATPSQPGRRR